jgi:hypothetical protein
MTPQEKANQLVDYFTNTMIEADMYGDYNEATKKSALIAVDELYRIAPWSLVNDIKDDSKQYWQEVKQEIEKI